jgi:hypothetical protein
MRVTQDRRAYKAQGEVDAEPTLQTARQWADLIEQRLRESDNPASEIKPPKRLACLGLVGNPELELD